jgi:acetyltransferase-like isoleucine patch superfamily enzyme
MQINDIKHRIKQAGIIRTFTQRFFSCIRLSFITLLHKNTQIHILSSNAANIKIYTQPNTVLIIGQHFVARNGVIIRLSLDAKLKIGNDVFINDYTCITARCNIEIGDKTIIGQNVLIYDHDHDYNSKNMTDNFVSKPVYIGKNVWIGSGVIILKGSTIGDGAVIGAGSLINSDVPPNTVVYNARENVFKKRNLNINNEVSRL